MQKLTQSMIRFSWSMPLLGLSQMAGFLASGGRNPLAETSETLDALSRAAYSQMDSRSQELYDRGEELQDRMTRTLLRRRSVDPDSCCGARR